MSKVHRFVSNDFTVRAACVDATEVVRKMQTLQDTYPIATVAVGRAMVGAILMASHLKQDQEVGVLLKGNGPLKSVYAEASFEGKVRGYTPHPHYQPANYSSLSTAEGIGHGTLTVVRHLPFQRLPHQGTVEIQTGEIGDDIAFYLSQSQQIRSVISLGVYLDTYGKVLSAGGVLLEVMPGVETEILQKIENNAKKASQPISKELLAGHKPVDIIQPYFEGIPYTELDHDYQLEFYCPCTVDRVLGALVVLGVDELQDMVNKNEPADVTCQMCGKPYRVDVQKLDEIKNKLIRESLH